MRILLVRRMCHAPHPRPNPAAIRFHPNRPHLDPVLFHRGITPQQLRKIIYSVHHHIDIPVMIPDPPRVETSSNLPSRIFRYKSFCCGYPASVRNCSTSGYTCPLQSKVSGQPSLSMSKNPQPHPRNCVCLPSPAGNVASSNTPPPKLRYSDGVSPAKFVFKMSRFPSKS